MSTLTFENVMGEIIGKYGHDMAACNVPSTEFESGGLFGELATAAGIESPSAYALMNNWNAWGASIDQAVEMFRANLDAKI